MFKKKLAFLLAVMFFVSLAGFVTCVLAGKENYINAEMPEADTKEEILLVTSFYPMYVLAENLTEGVEGITVSNLTENHTGCLHDYQLTSGDMKLLNRADAFLVNGAGMELFMEKVLAADADLTVMEASYEIALLEGIAHHHHGEELHEGDVSDENHEEELHGKEEHSGNGHVWMDVERYGRQVENVTAELVKLLPEQADTLLAATAVYKEKLSGLSKEVTMVRELAKGTPVVIFHEAFAYLAESLGMEVLTAVSLDEETVPSAGEIAEMIEEIRYHGFALILIEEAYKDYAEKIMAETEAEVVYLDPLTTGDGNADSYIHGMQRNLEAVRNVLK